MIPLQRRFVLASGATLASALLPRKLRAAPRSGLIPDLGHMKDTPGTSLPDFEWKLPDGTIHTVTDYAGKGIVLNLWATWCVPCVAEMPALDGLAAALTSSGVVVLPLSSDRGGAGAVERFYREHAVKNLPIVLDPTGAAAHILGARGIPTTILIDSTGHERGRLEGGADWNSEKSIAMVKRLASSG